MAVSRIKIYGGNPTVGKTDGTAISSGTYRSSIAVELNALENEEKIIKLAIRTDTDYKTVGNTKLYFQYTTDSLATERSFDYLKFSRQSNGSSATNTLQISDEINSTNTIFYLVVSSRRSDSVGKDRSIQLVVSGTVVSPDDYPGRYLLTESNQSSKFNNDKFYYWSLSDFNLSGKNELWIKLDYSAERDDEPVFRLLIANASGSTDTAVGLRLYASSSPLVISSYVNGEKVESISTSDSGYTYYTGIFHTLLLHVKKNSDPAIEFSINGFKGTARVFTQTSGANHNYPLETIMLNVPGGHKGERYGISGADDPPEVSWLGFSYIIVSDSKMKLDDYDYSTAETLDEKSFFDFERGIKKHTSGFTSFDVVAQFFSAVKFDVSVNFYSDISTYPTDSAEIFPVATSEPVTIPAVVEPDAAANTSGIQSISIQIAEQQITDQVSFTGIIPFDILDYIRGQYFDYVYNMRIESVTQSGILFACRCCTDSDESLYTMLQYDAEVDSKYLEWHDVNIGTSTNTTDDEDEDSFIGVQASQHFWNMASFLGLEPKMQIADFSSTFSENVGGMTLYDLIRSIFGWTARIPPHMINVFIRGNQLCAIQRGHEEHVIDISNANITQPVFSRELVRTFRAADSVNYKTEVRTIPTYTTKPVYEGVDKAKVQPLASDTRVDKDGTTTINYSYDSDGMLVKTEETSPTSRTVTTHTYITGANGNKFLSKEETTVYDLTGSQIDYRSVKHSPTNYGQAAVTAGNDQSENIVSTVKNVPYDERPTPYALGQQLKALVSEQSGSKRQERLVPGIVDYDTSFPVADIHTLYRITAAITKLNRKIQETVTLSLFGCPHVIDFNDRIILFGNEYFLKSNNISTTPRIFHQQNLTLVRWIGYPADMYEDF